MRVDGLHFQYGHYQEKIKDINICIPLFGVRGMGTTLRKERISFVIPVCPSVRNNSAPTGRSSVRLDTGDIYTKKVTTAFKCGQNRTKMNDNVYEHLPHLWRYLAAYGISTQLTIYTS